MKAYGTKKHGNSKAPGHQDCGTCQPSVKNRKSKARHAGEKEVRDFVKFFGKVMRTKVTVAEIFNLTTFGEHASCFAEEPVSPPKVGQDIYVGTSWYIDHGEDDFNGGLAKVTKVEWDEHANGGDYCVYIAERPGHGYYWSGLAERQAALKKEFKRRRSHPDPDWG